MWARDKLSVSHQPTGKRGPLFHTVSHHIPPTIQRRRVRRGRGREGANGHLHILPTIHPQNHIPQRGKNCRNSCQGQPTLPHTVFIHGVKSQDLLSCRHAAFPLGVGAGEGHPLELALGVGVEAPLDEGHVGTPVEKEGGREGGREG